MSEEIVIHEDNANMQIYVPAIKGVNTVVHTKDEVAKQTTSNDVSLPNISKDYAKWGDDNMYPTNARIKSEKSGVFKQNAFVKSCMFFGQGLDYYKRTPDGLEYIVNDEIEEFKELTCLDVYLLEQIQSFYIHFCSITEHLMQVGSSTNKGNKIKALSSLETEWSRLSKTENGQSKLLYYSAQFAKNGSYDKNNGTKLKLVHRSSKKDFLKYLGNDRKFAQFISFPTPGRAYYPNAPWSELFEPDSWLDIAIETPKLIRAIHRNLINIKYVIHIPMNYWSFQYPKWDSYDAKRRKKLIDEKAIEMNNYLAGGENQHKSMIAHYGYNESTGKEYPGFKVESIRDYTKHDAYLPNSQAANSEICYHQGVNPSTLGLQTPGGKLGAGSGSDIRVATNREVSLLSALESILLQPIYFAHRWNEWDKDIVWKFKRSFITTLDQDKSGQKETNEFN